MNSTKFNDFCVFTKQVNYLFEVGYLLTEFVYCKKDRILTLCFGTNELILNTATEKNRDDIKEICMSELFKDEQEVNGEA